MQLVRAALSNVSRNVLSIPGWRTRRKLIVIESDDWGSIRMPDAEVYAEFLRKGLDLAGSDYNRLDTLESNEDLESLFDVLRRYTDRSGNHPVITANFVVGNPDFEKIQKSGFREYFFEPVSVTLGRYVGRERVEALWYKGRDEGIFHPQYHGREHVNVVRWMEALRRSTPEIMFTFACRTTFSGDGDYNFMEVLDYNSPKEISEMKRSLLEGLDMFEKLFGFRSRSFIPPCYTWSSEIEEALHRGGIDYIQGLIVQSVPTGSFGRYRRKYHYLGQRNILGQCYLIRNCFFEPSLTAINDPVDECMSRIRMAFRWGKPAVISTHRINFMGSLDVANREKNLKALKGLLDSIFKAWPEVEFITSDRLGDIITGRA